MNDKELLELAAKTAGLQVKKNLGTVIDADTEDLVGIRVRINWNDRYKVWNPLTDDGDALRLAVKLKIEIAWDAFQEPEVMAAHEDQWWLEPYGNDPYAATRRAIVRAAAEIGRSMK